MKKRNIYIAGTGKYLPKEIVTSSDLDKRLGKNDGWVKNKSGISQRHFANCDETTSFMAAQAAKQALSQANIAPEELDCIVGACGVMEQAIPCTAVLIQKQLGLETSGIAAFDINSTCLSFLSALDLLSYMVDAGRFKNVLIVSSDIPSVGLNWDDTDSCTIFGDGAAAVIISKAAGNEYTKILSSHMETYSKGSEYCQVLAGGTKLHPSRFEGDYAKSALFEMNGRRTYNLAAQAVDLLVDKLLNEAGLTLEEINWIIPHQASKLSIYHLKKHLGIANEKIVNIYSNHGNQIAASIPTALHEAIATQKIKHKNKLLIIGTGAGISVSGMLMEYNQ